MSLPSKVCAAALLAASVGGCQALGGGGGVMPESELGPPPSMRSAVPAKTRTARADDEAPVATGPTRRLDLPKTVGGGARTADAGPRRIRRDEIDGAAEGGGGSSNSLSPTLTPGGGMGVGGKF